MNVSHSQASGVESSRGVKGIGLIRDFVQAAKMQ
jgi:phosphoribosylanthranilate isomerase